VVEEPSHKVRGCGPVDFLVKVGIGVIAKGGGKIGKIQQGEERFRQDGPALPRRAFSSRRSCFLGKIAYEKVSDTWSMQSSRKQYGGFISLSGSG